MSIVGAGASARSRGQGAGYQASASTTSVSASTARSSRNPSHPPVSALSLPLKGGAPKRRCIVISPVKGGCRTPGSSLAGA
jgi:hypothetical protein